MSEAAAYKLASVLLQYPTVALFDGISELDAFAATTSPRQARTAFARFLAWLRATDPADVAQHYVQTFDLPQSSGGREGSSPRRQQSRCALYLTYYRYGDTRKRGMAMLAFKSAYRTAGFEPSDDDLPDYLPLVLDFAALTPRGEALLHAHRADLELLRRALHQAGTPYAHITDAVCAQLPRPGPRDLALIRQYWGQEPPAEQVGRQPFAPSQYLTGEGVPP